MVPTNMIDNASDINRNEFFERNGNKWILKQNSSNEKKRRKPTIARSNPKASLSEVIIGATTTEATKQSYPKNIPDKENHELFVDFIHRMLQYDPVERIKPEDALLYPFIVEADGAVSASLLSSTNAIASTNIRMRQHRHHDFRPPN